MQALPNENIKLSKGDGSLHGSTICPQNHQESSVSALSALNTVATSSNEVSIDISCKQITARVTQLDQDNTDCADIKYGELSEEKTTDTAGTAEIVPTGQTNSEINNIPTKRKTSFRIGMGKKGWSRVKTAVAITSMLQETRSKSPSTPKANKLERQDSFIKKFSTLRHNNETTTGATGRLDSDEEDQLDRQTSETDESSTTKELGRKHSFRQGTCSKNGIEDEENGSDVMNKTCCYRYRQNIRVCHFFQKLRHCVFDPQSDDHMRWLGIVTICVLYNLWSCIAREAFKEIRINYDAIWFTLDAIADFVYLTDIVVQLRTSYLECGLLVKSTKKLTQNYVKSKYFVLDLLSLAPFDLIQIVIGIHPITRFPRFIKVYRAIKWKSQVENRTQYPNVWRVLNLIHILLIGAHWFAAFYYLISESCGFGEDDWVYPVPNGTHAEVTRKYLRSLYWATLTLTTIGDLPAPQKNWEYVFTILSYLIGVFVFATIVGQVGNVITNRNAARQEFEQILDNAKSYMRLHNVPNEMQIRVLRWYDYAWARGRTNGGGDINALGLLPDKLKTELALHVNLETLRKVTIFQECRPEFLHDLVLKMKPYIFTPGDYICRKGEVAREMFIIADGVLEVISDREEVLAKMGSGAFFGEIGILNLEGGINRRTADVRSVGYCELFVLSKEDVLNALKDHPDAETLIKEYARKRLQEMEAHRVKRLTVKSHKSREKFPLPTFSDPKSMVPESKQSLLDATELSSPHSHRRDSSCSTPLSSNPILLISSISDNDSKFYFDAEIANNKLRRSSFHDYYNTSAKQKLAQTKLPTSSSAREMPNTTGVDKIIFDRKKTSRSYTEIPCELAVGTVNRHNVGYMTVCNAHTESHDYDNSKGLLENIKQIVQHSMLELEIKFKADIEVLQKELERKDAYIESLQSELQQTKKHIPMHSTKCSGRLNTTTILLESNKNRDKETQDRSKDLTDSTRC